MPLGEISRQRLIAALDEAGGNRSRAAECLGIGRATLYRWLTRYGLDGKPPALVADRYDVERLLGEGTQGSVYLVRDRAAGNAERALKLLSGAQLDALDVERIRSEFRALAFLRHSGLVRVHDFGIDDATRRPFLVLDLAVGRPFANAAIGAAPSFILAAFAEVLRAVDHLHRHGLVHRDLKSENVLVERAPDGALARVTVMDLGLSERLAGPALAPGGTMLYAAPEILAGGRASVRSDLYALGVMLYLALTGTYPFQGTTAADTIALQQRDAPAPPSSLRPGISAATDAIVLRLLVADPALRYPDAAAVLDDLALAVPLTVTPRWAAALVADTLVGRDDDLVRAVTRLSAPRERRATPWVVLSGEPGIGKTRLLDAVLDELRIRGLQVARSVSRSATGQGFGALPALLGEALRGADGRGSSLRDHLVTRHRQALSQVAPSFAERDGETAREPLDRARSLDSLASLFLDLAREQPLVLAVDDLHDTDPFLLDLLATIARRGTDVPICLAGTSRPPEPGTPWAAFVRAGAAEGLLAMHDVGPLARDAVQTIAAGVLGPARAELLGEALTRLSGGNPFFLRAVLRDLADSAAAVPADAPLALPASAHESVTALLRRADARERDVLAAIAIAGQPVPDHDLVALAGEHAVDVLAALAARGLIVRIGGGRCELAHAFLRDALVSDIDPGEKQRWHRAWADLTEADPDRVVEYAGHLLGAGVAAKDAFLRAADRLERAWQHRAALRFLEAACDGFERSDPALLELLPRLERAAKVARDIDRSAAACRDWAALAATKDDRIGEARARSLLAARLREQGNLAEARAAAERALELAGAADSIATLGVAERVLATVLWVAWDHAGALTHFERVLDIFNARGDVHALASAYNDVALARALAGRPAGGCDAAAAATRLFDEAGDPVWTQYARSNDALIKIYLGDLDGAAATLRDVVERIRAIGGTVPAEMPLENLAFVLLRQGRYTEALTVTRDLLDEAVRNGRHTQRVSALLAAGEALFQLDERDAARDHHRLAFELAGALGERSQLLFAQLARARDRRVDGASERATELARGVFDEAVRRGNRRLVTAAALELARLARSAGDAARAHAFLDDAEEALVVPREDGPAQRAMLLYERAATRQFEGSIAMASADVAEALGLARRAGPADVEIRLLTLASALHDACGEAHHAADSLLRAAERAREVASFQHDPRRQARYLGRPDLLALFEAAARRTGDRTSSASGPSAGSADALAGLYEIGRRVADGGDKAPLLERIVELAVERSGAERGLLLLYDRETGALAPAASRGALGVTESDAVRISRSVLAKAGRGSAVLVPDASVHPDLARAASVALFGIRSVMCVPLRIGDDVLGTLYVDTCAKQALFGEHELRYLEALADQAAIALDYARVLERLSRERRVLQHTAQERYGMGQLVGRSPAMRAVFELIEKVAPSRLPVLIQGASGTGKELVARALHFNSPRRERLFLSENCAALPEALLESLLFGHARGAFTGADSDRRGLFEQADGGTLFLDEIGDMSAGLQAKLLRVLQEQEVRPLGSERPLKVDVRIVTATHRDLRALVAAGRFREDLLFRLDGITLNVPALAERREDIPLLFRHFLERECERAGRPVPEVEASALRTLALHDWPGNVRELENVARRALIFAEGRAIDRAVLASDPSLAAVLARSAPPPRAAGPRGAARLDPDSPIDLQRALDAADGDRVVAARLLGISRATLYRRLQLRGQVRPR